MKLVKTLLATTLAITAFSTFAASDKTTKAAEQAERVIVSTQEQASDVTPAADSTTAAQPTTESGAEAPTTSAPQAGQ